MNLHPRRPPGHAKRKALSYAAEIVSLRLQGHTLAAIREALEDAGVRVSLSTVRREAMRGALPTSSDRPAARPSAPPVVLTTRGQAVSPIPSPDPAFSTPSLPGKAIAEEFMRGRPTNPLFLKESST